MRLPSHEQVCCLCTNRVQERASENPILGLIPDMEKNVPLCKCTEAAR
jgi:hypothetical protein